MANIMTKRGTQDNIVTYEHMCDTMTDLQNIDPKFITLGSIALVLKGETGVEFYIANSKKEWTPIISGGTEGSFSPDITDPQDGDTLVYDGNTGVWVNGAGGSSGGGGVFEVHKNPNDSWLLDATPNQVKAAINAGKFVYLLSDDGYEEPYDGDDPQYEGGSYVTVNTRKVSMYSYQENGSYFRHADGTISDSNMGSTIYFGNQYYYANNLDEYYILPD